MLVDSGVKTIRATVTDAAGRTSSAEIDMYVVLVIWGPNHPLTEGQTYRLFGNLLTAPVGVSTRVGGYSVDDCSDDDACEPGFEVYATGVGFFAVVSIGENSGRIFGQGMSLDNDGAVGSADLRRQVEGILAALVESIGQPPLQGVQE